VNFHGHVFSQRKSAWTKGCFGTKDYQNIGIENKCRIGVVVPSQILWNAKYRKIVKVAIWMEHRNEKREIDTKDFFSKRLDLMFEILQNSYETSHSIEIS